MIDFLPNNHVLQSAVADADVVRTGGNIKERQRHFALAISAGFSRAEALKVAGYNPSPENTDATAYRLIQHPLVKQYMTAIRKFLMIRAGRDYARAVEQIRETRAKAKAAGMDDVVTNLHRLESELFDLDPLD